MACRLTFQISTAEKHLSGSADQETMDIMFEALSEVFDSFRRRNNPNAKDKWSPTFKHQFRLIVELLKDTPRQNWFDAAERIQSKDHRNLVHEWLHDMKERFPTRSSRRGGDRRRKTGDIYNGEVNHTADGGDGGVRTRTPRQSKIHPSIEQRRSSRLIEDPNASFHSYQEMDDDEIANASDDSMDPGRTYPKSYVDTHPDEGPFYHSGNGYWKKGGRMRTSKRSMKSPAGRRQSTRSRSVINDGSAAKIPGPEVTLHDDELWKYPRQQFHRTRNNLWKIGPGPGGKRAGVIIGDDGALLPVKTQSQRGSADDEYQNVAVEEDHEDENDEGMEEVEDDQNSDEPTQVHAKMKRSNQNEDHETVDKAYTLLHPEYRWSHRGNGRYRRISDPIVVKKSTTPLPSSERRSNRSAPGSRVADEQSTRSSTRTKANSRPASDATTDDVLYDKAYILAHPEEEFHHRGQGRWARGPRQKPQSAAQIDEEQEDEQDGEEQQEEEVEEEEEEDNEAEEKDAEEVLVDSAFTLAHPELTFHHRGQGKWARGLPPPGSSNKIAVRGPGARDRGDESRSPDQEVDEDGNPPPGLTALVRREEGPDKWPKIDWVYRGGGKWCRTSKEDQEPKVAPPPPVISKRLRGTPNRTRVELSADAQLQREVGLAATATATQVTPTTRRTKLLRGNSDLSEADTVRLARTSHAPQRAPTPRPALLAPEDDRLLDDDLPSLYKEAWSTDDDEETAGDEASKILRAKYEPIIDPEAFVRALTKFDPAVRSLESLKQLASNAQYALRLLQDEYLEIDKLVASNPMHGKKERKPARGGRQPVDHLVFEDKKEAILYDYAFDARRVGYQDPDSQKIIRDEEGRELRRRRGRHNPVIAVASAAAPNSTIMPATIPITATPEVVCEPKQYNPYQPINVFTDVEELPSKRTVKPISRFDGLTTAPPRKKSRLAQATTAEKHNEAAADSDSRSSRRLGTPSQSNPALAVAEEYKVPTRGRWKNHVPKRIRELRGDSVGSTSRASLSDAGSDNATNSETTHQSPNRNDPKVSASFPPPSPSTALILTPDDVASLSPHRGSRATGSKNTNWRKDAGIKKPSRRQRRRRVTTATASGAFEHSDEDDDESAMASPDEADGVPSIVEEDTAMRSTSASSLQSAAPTTATGDSGAMATGSRGKAATEIIEEHHPFAMVRPPSDPAPSSSRFAAPYTQSGWWIYTAPPNSRS
jgi:hypothetical protein